MHSFVSLCHGTRPSAVQFNATLLAKTQGGRDFSAYVPRDGAVGHLSSYLGERLGSTMDADAILRATTVVGAVRSASLTVRFQRAQTVTQATLSSVLNVGDQISAIAAFIASFVLVVLRSAMKVVERGYELCFPTVKPVVLSAAELAEAEAEAARILAEAEKVWQPPQREHSSAEHSSAGLPSVMGGGGGGDSGSVQVDIDQSSVATSFGMRRMNMLSPQAIKQMAHENTKEVAAVDIELAVQNPLFSHSDHANRTESSLPASLPASQCSGPGASVGTNSASHVPRTIEQQRAPAPRFSSLASIRGAGPLLAAMHMPPSISSAASAPAVSAPAAPSDEMAEYLEPAPAQLAAIVSSAQSKAPSPRDLFASKRTRVQLQPRPSRQFSM